MPRDQKFKIQAPFPPKGDQPKAIAKLVEGARDGLAHQVLLGATGTGKTYTMANVIQTLQRPALVVAHNKTLAAQLCQELREFFPDNAVEYFVSYYDYYQPEAYVPASDLYIEKVLPEPVIPSKTCSFVPAFNSLTICSMACGWSPFG